MNIDPVSMNIPTTLTPGVESAPKGFDVPSDKKGFGDLLTDMVEKVDGLQKSSSAAVEDVVTGRATDIHQVAVKVQEAGIAFDLMLGIRNRLMDVYNELIKMAP